VSPSLATGCTPVTPSTAATCSAYAVTSASDAPRTSSWAVEVSGPKSDSFSAATWDGASEGSTR
jgi:hypothetical protein